MKKQQAIGINYQLIRDDYIGDSTDCMEFMKIVKASQGFGITLSFQPTLLKMASFIVLLIGTRGRILLKREGPM